MNDELILYKNKNYKGDHIHIFGSVESLHDQYGLSDQVSSAIVRGGIWVFHENSNYGGDYKEFGVGFYPDLASAGFANDKLSSIKKK